MFAFMMGILAGQCITINIVVLIYAKLTFKTGLLARIHQILLYTLLFSRWRYPAKADIADHKTNASKKH